jgi:putative BNR repeat neuraminidase
MCPMHVSRRTLFASVAAPFLPLASEMLPLGIAHAATSVNATIFCHPLASGDEAQYAAFYNSEARVVLAMRSWSERSFISQVTPHSGNVRDAHNGIALGVDGNGILHLSWDHHNHPLRYVRSAKSGSLELTEKLPMNGDEEERVTYPEFFPLPNGDLLFLYRSGASGNGNTVLKRWDLGVGKWATVQSKLIDGEGERNAYTNQIAVDGEGRWHLSWCWRETGDVATNHDICYARSDDEGRSWRKSTSETYRLPITEATAEIALPIPQRSVLINQTTMTVDQAGRPQIATYFRPSSSAAPQIHVIWHDGRAWRASRATNRKLDFRLSGGGTRSIPMSRPLLLVDRQNRSHIIWRDEERSNGISLATCAELEEGVWSVRDLTTDPLDRWEPTCDLAAWRTRNELYLYHQRVGQGDGERSVEMAPTEASVLLGTL